MVLSETGGRIYALSTDSRLVACGCPPRVPSETETWTKTQHLRPFYGLRDAEPTSAHPEVQSGRVCVHVILRSIGDESLWSVSPERQFEG
jgi:hypothetical protein